MCVCVHTGLCDSSFLHNFVVGSLSIDSLKPGWCVCVGLICFLHLFVCRDVFVDIDVCINSNEGFGICCHWRVYHDLIPLERDSLASPPTHVLLLTYAGR